MKASKRVQLINALTLLFVVLLCCGKIAAQEIRNTRGYAAAMNTSGAMLGVSDDKFTGSPGWVSGFTNTSNYARVELAVDEDQHVFHTKFTATITFDITLIDASLNSTTLTGRSLTVYYDPALEYNDKAQLTWNGYYHIDISNISITAVDGSSNPITVPGEVYLQAEVGTDRIYDFSAGVTTMGNFSKGHVAATREMEVHWDFVPGAHEYELEWTHVDDYTDVNGSYLSTSGISYDLSHDASRIVTPFNFYRIPRLYEHGYIVYRVRPIGRTSAGVECDGVWTTVPISGTVAGAISSSATSVDTVHAFRNDSVNWTSVKTFAEQGKQGVGVNFMDGMMYTHQSIARLNTDGKSLVQNTLYDNFGRAVINMLPVPVAQLHFKYVRGLNKAVVGGSTVIFDKSVIGECSGSVCGGSISFALDTVNSYGAANYYSASNSDRTGYKGYIPTAKGLPYMQVQYMPDASGRVAKQTMPGLTHQLGSGRETKFFYTNPAQIELYNLFGAESGQAKFYKKNIVVDANGQGSVTYIDKYGRTAATSLIGDAPAQLDELDDKTAPVSITEDETYFNDTLSETYCYVVNTSFYVPNTGDQQVFYYKTTLGTFIAAECSSNVCLDCAYDLTLSIKDDCGTEVFKSATSDPSPAAVDATIGAQPTYSTNCTTNFFTSGTFYEINSTPITITFPHAGVYSVYKKICVSDAPVEAYKNIYLSTSPCVYDYCHYADSVLNTVNFSKCSPSCSDCGNINGYNNSADARHDTLNAHGQGPYYQSLTAGNDSVSVSGSPDQSTDYNMPTVASSQEYCKKFCDPKTYGCDYYKNLMAHDFYPGGQYGETNSGTFPNFYFSIFNATNSFSHYGGSSSPPCWSNPPLPYQNADGTISVVNIGGVNYYPQQLSESDFLAYWQNSWALSFLPISPEYCKLNFLCETIGCSLDYDQQMLATDNYGDACANGFLFPVTGLTFSYGPSGSCSSANTDPLFCTSCTTCPNISSTILTSAEITSFNNSLTSYSSGQSIYEFATDAAGYGSLPSGYTFGSSACTQDEEWKQFRIAYLQLKVNLYYAMYANYLGTSPAGCSTLIVPGTSTHYGSPHVTAFNDSLQHYYGSGVTQPSSSPTAASTYTASSTFNSSLASDSITQCLNSCYSDTAVWRQNLYSCPAFTAATSPVRDSIISNLVDICFLGCDGHHPSGSSDFPSVSPSYVHYTIPSAVPTHTVNSFQGVLDYYLGTSACDVNLITGPQPYTYSGNGVNAAANYLDNCGCDKVLQVDYDFTHITLPAGVTTKRGLFKYRYGFDLTNYNVIVCTCNGAATGGWSSGYSWSGTEITNLVNEHVPVDNALRCKSCVTCTGLTSALGNMATQYSFTYNTANVIDFFDNHSQQAINFLNYAFNENFTLQQYQELLLDCDSFATSPTTNSLTYNITPEAEALEVYLNQLADGGMLAIDHSMVLCKDQDFFLSPLYTGALPPPTGGGSIGYYYHAFISGSTLTINIEDANNSYAVLCTITLTLPGGSAIGGWSIVDQFSYLRAYAATPVAGNNYGFKVDVSDGTNWSQATGSSTCWPTCNLSAAAGPQLCPADPVTPKNDCASNLIKNALASAKQIYDQQIEAEGNYFVAQYKSSCFAQLTETFTRVYDNKEYHYVLYYYDQAGNLTRTVAPKGVLLLGATSLPGGSWSYPSHSSASFGVSAYYNNLYHYNSYNQPDTASSIDGGLTAYHYDMLGRIVFSQNEQQLALKKFSYTEYDALGRISQTGEGTYSSPFGAPSETTAEDPFVYSIFMAAATRAQVVSTYYDDGSNDPNSSIGAQFTGGQQNLRNRVVATTYEEVYDGTASTYDYGTHYSYDEHGNVTQLVQEYPGLNHLVGQRYKTTLYDFDLISGNVNQVNYQPGQGDHMMHKYYYDDDNRLHEVYTSRDSVNWDRDAKYFFHEYGPLARVEAGDKKVQGQDYLYTIHGWIKGFNANLLDEKTDPGKDAADNTVYSSVQGLHKYVGRDAAAYNLNYYHTTTEEDYMAVKYNDYNGTTNKNPLADKGNLYSGSAAGFVLDTHGPSLFNGNISSMATTLVNKNSSVSTVGLNAAFVQLSGYRYDQLNRLKQLKTYRTMSYGSNAWTLPTTGNSDDAYLNQFSYDANGNILTQKRNGPTTALLSGGTVSLDDLSYTYNVYGVHRSNQLYCVSDAVSASNYNDDLDDQSSSCVTDPLSGAYTSSNYGYNKIGSLAKDKQECIDTIIWTVDRKVRYIIRNATLLSAAGRTLDDIEYQYDANRRRVCKIVKPRDGTTKALKDQDSWVYTYYVYDGGGNVMATYERNYTLSSGTYTDHYALKELDLYGSKRLGLVHTDADGDITNRTFTASMSSGLFTGISYNTAPAGYSYANPLATKRWLGRKELELTNHLGNVITTTSDRKLQDEYGADAGSNSTVDYYTADILSESDYYPFGAPMAGRSTPGSTYRYGFNGQEHENEVVTGNHSAEYWMYDARLGRRWNVDPVTHEYESPYATFDNNPIYYSDPDGADKNDVIEAKWNKATKKYDNTKVSDEYGKDVTVTHYTGGDHDGKWSETFQGTETFFGGGIGNIPNIKYSDSDYDNGSVASDASGRDWKTTVNSGINIINDGLNLLNAASHPKETYTNVKSSVNSTVDYFSKNSPQQVGNDIINGAQGAIGNPEAADKVLSWALITGAAGIGNMGGKTDFFAGTKYTNKVLAQMKKGDYHGFPESVKAFQNSGTVIKIKGGDGVVREMLKIPGEYHGKKGNFEFIKEANGSINHRLFRPN